ncbi:MAG: 1-acyl-sn-glycerol-3-phosphate acyltransferase [Bacteroidales bacterium]|nr:1-acyl-sn-glycerol-3-phosphate acyltransferase [Bacteroidales bacterium]
MAKRKVLGAVDRIDRRNLIYTLLYTYVNAVFNQYYRKVEVHGLENIPRDAPVIFSPNHQNALMDALIVLFSSPGDTVFLARADLFRKKMMAKALNSLKMLPVFRLRDGVDELGKNQEIFDITVGVLHRKHQLCIMPEGNHGDKRRLRNLGKGIFRIAFKTQEKMGNRPYVKIVPVGLDFSDYIKHYQKLHVVYGKPIEVSDYWDTFAENGPRGLNQLKQRLTDDIKPLMIHIETEAYYDTYMGLRTIFNDRMREILSIKGTGLNERFRSDKEMIRRLDALLEKDEEKMIPLKSNVENYMQQLKILNIRDWVVRSGGFSVLRCAWRYLTLLLTLPLFIYGFINNALMYFIPVRMVKNVKDVQFHSSIKAGAAILLVVPLTYLVQTAIVGVLTSGWYYWAGYLVTLYPAGKFALLWYLRLKKTLRGGWFGHKYRKGSSQANALVELRNTIIKDTEELIV